MLYPLPHPHRLQIASKHAALCDMKVQSLRLPPFAHPPLREDVRLKIGYVSSDFGNHPTSHLVASVPKSHRNVDAYCFALSADDGSSFRRRIAASLRDPTRFVDLSSADLTVEDCASRISQLGIHILVNMNGYTRGAKNEIFALRPAPLQALWLGYPGSMGATWIDYLVTDAQSTPLPASPGGQATAEQFSEKLACLPSTFFIGDHVAMFPHLNQRVLVVEDDGTPLRDKVAQLQLRGAGCNEGATTRHTATAFAILNGLNLMDQLTSLAKDGEVLNLTVNASGGGASAASKRECVLPVIRLAADPESIIALTKCQSSDDKDGAAVNGVFVQNGNLTWWECMWYFMECDSVSLVVN